jgi:nucleolar protein 56
MHPAVHGAPASQKGKVARALAAKLSIAARMDLNGSPVLQELKDSLDRRLERLKTEPLRQRPPRDRTVGRRDRGGEAGNDRRGRHPHR